jgi:hypothetical protein
MATMYLAIPYHQPKTKEYSVVYSLREARKKILLATMARLYIFSS